MQHYRFYFFDVKSKLTDFGEDDFPEESLAVAAAQQRLNRRQGQVVEVWQQTKMVYRGRSTMTREPLRPERF